jgi:predicted acetylornithine/succinylornithine family transaminase
MSPQLSQAQIESLYAQHLMTNYSPPAPVTFSRGEGCRLWDVEGNEYLDFVAGISVLATGHSHPRVVEAVREQAARLVHTSNLFSNEQQARLAEKLTGLCCLDRVFFCNSGTEANEAALKLARKWALTHKPGATRVVTALKSFHGRTMGSLAATGQEKYQKAFAPMISGFDYVPLNDIAAVEQAITGDTCAVMLEPIQAEGGMNVAAPDYLPAVRELCTERGVLLILDEVQTGLGRTGKWWGYEHAGVEPDVMTVAKALGSGLPIGACLAREESAAFEPGDHAATFGGNHLCCAAALATLEVIEEEGLVQRAADRGELLRTLLLESVGKHPAFVEIRGVGLLQALVLREEQVQAKQIAAEALGRGLVLNALGSDRIRLAPPLVVSEAECERAVATIAACLQDLT